MKATKRLRWTAGARDDGFFGASCAPAAAGRETCRELRVRAGSSAADQIAASEAVAGLLEAARSMLVTKRLRWTAAEMDDCFFSVHRVRGSDWTWDMPRAPRSGGKQRCGSDCCFWGYHRCPWGHPKRGGDDGGTPGHLGPSESCHLKAVHRKTLKMKM